MIIFINIGVRLILAGHKSKGYSCTSVLISDRMCFLASVNDLLLHLYKFSATKILCLCAHWIFSESSRRQEQNSAPELHECR